MLLTNSNKIFKFKLSNLNFIKEHLYFYFIFAIIYYNCINESLIMLICPYTLNFNMSHIHLIYYNITRMSKMSSKSEIEPFLTTEVNKFP